MTAEFGEGGKAMYGVFPRRTKWTPTDERAYIGDPPLFLLSCGYRPVRISVTFTWDIHEGMRLFRAWEKFSGGDIQIGGPAFNDPGDIFLPGQFIKPGVVITSRGCPYSCPWCFVPGREGNIRELSIMEGYIVQDNNLLACSEKHIESVFAMLALQHRPAEFPGGLDAKLLTQNHVRLLKSIRVNQMWFSCDTANAINQMARISDLLVDFPRNKKRVYALIGFNGESMSQAELRLRRIYELGFLPFAMLFRPLDATKEKDKRREWREFQRTWCRPAAYKTLLKKDPIP